MKKMTGSASSKAGARPPLFARDLKLQRVSPGKIGGAATGIIPPAFQAVGIAVPLRGGKLPMCVL